MLKLEKRTYLFIFSFLCIFLVSLPSSAKELTSIQEQAQFYRNQGLKFQRQGRLDEAITCYQKAIILDPNSAVAYNDLGIIYEAKGWLDRAEEIYLTALEISPGYPNLYSNLAMLYEQKGNYKRAAAFWKKRIELGSPDEDWTQKAKQRLEALRREVPELRQEYIQEEIFKLAQELSNKKRIKRLKDLSEAQRLFDEARLLYQNAEYEKALNSINLALSLNPEDEGKESLVGLREEINIRLIEQEEKARIAEINRLFDEARSLYKNTEYEKALNSVNLALSLNPEDEGKESLLRLKDEIEKGARIAQMETHFQNAMRYYQQDRLQEAAQELDKITTEITSKTSLKTNN